MRRIQQLIAGKGDNYILPFFWQHGEEEAVLRDYMRAIADCGIGEVCVECRPHPDFCGPKWWQDMDIILEEAKARGMGIWLLDDAHFPTGYANGVVKDADPELCKQYLYYHAADVSGGIPQVTLDVASMAKHQPNPFAGASLFARGVEFRQFDDDALLKVIACPLERDGALGAALDLTDLVEDGTLTWDVPAGYWRLFVFYLTRNGGGRTDYINLLDEQSCRQQIDAVYEPHWERYKAEFGKTFRGFFSDEPLVGNTLGFPMDDSIGRKDMPLPWSSAVLPMLIDRLGPDWALSLPALWQDLHDADTTAQARYAYMDVATRLVQQNFSEQLGKWCEEHGVEYIGHIIEDSNQHSRLGCSVGHFFRGLQGQHMAGIDDIGGQVLLNGENHQRDTGLLKGDGEFYHFTLGKLASSHAHIDPKKKGRAMCEIFGAYGWSFGVREMKYTLDHFLVRGVNQYVPHAFSPKAFPDPDCPPHFYAHGHNPQYRHFQSLMRYMNRMCHLTSGGTHIAPVAMLYHGEAEWTGGYMFNQKPARALLENQIDFDILPSDLFADPSACNAALDGQLRVNGETYQALVIPYAEYVTAAVARFAAESAEKGFPVVFVDARPSGIADTADAKEADALLKGIQGCTVVPLEGLATFLRKARNLWEVEASPAFPRLRYYHYRHADGDILLLSNEDACLPYSGEITLRLSGPVAAYDAFANLLRPVAARQADGNTILSVTLEPYQMLALAFGDMPADLPILPEAMPTGQRIPVTGPWQLSMAKALEYPSFGPPESLPELMNIGRLHPEFSGHLRYENTISLPAAEKAVLAIDDAYDGVEVWVNGQYAGARLCPSYRFDISQWVKQGENHLRIEVATTLDREVRAMKEDESPMFLRESPVQLPTGLIGQVAVYTE